MSVDIEPIFVGYTGLIVVVALCNGIGDARLLDYRENVIDCDLYIVERLVIDQIAVDILDLDALLAVLTVNAEVAEPPILNDIARDDNKVGVGIRNGEANEIQHIVGGVAVVLHIADVQDSEFAVFESQFGCILCRRKHRKRKQHCGSEGNA